MLCVLCLLLLRTGSPVSGSAVRGAVGQSVTLPCTYPVGEGSDVTTMCWGRGPCSTYRCRDEILRTDGWSVTWSKSSRYQLKGDIPGGDVFLTIDDVMASDSGTYCCRVEISGWFNDIKRRLDLVVDTGSQTSTPASGTSTSAYSVQTSDSSPQTQVSVDATSGRSALGLGVQSNTPGHSALEPKVGQSCCNTSGRSTEGAQKSATMTYTLGFMGGLVLLLTLAVVTGFYLKRQKVKKDARDASPLPRRSRGLVSAVGAHYAEDNIYSEE